MPDQSAKPRRRILKIFFRRKCLTVFLFMDRLPSVIFCHIIRIFLHPPGRHPVFDGQNHAHLRRIQGKHLHGTVQTGKVKSSLLLPELIHPDSEPDYLRSGCNGISYKKIARCRVHAESARQIIINRGIFPAVDQEPCAFSGSGDGCFHQRNALFLLGKTQRACIMASFHPDVVGVQISFCGCPVFNRQGIRNFQSPPRLPLRRRRLDFPLNALFSAIRGNNPEVKLIRIDRRCLDDPRRKTLLPGFQNFNFSDRTGIGIIDTCSPRGDRRGSQQHHRSKERLRHPVPADMAHPFPIAREIHSPAVLHHIKFTEQSAPCLHIMHPDNDPVFTCLEVFRHIESAGYAPVASASRLLSIDEYLIQIIARRDKDSFLRCLFQAELPFKPDIRIIRAEPVPAPDPAAAPVGGRRIQMRQSFQKQAGISRRFSGNAQFCRNCRFRRFETYTLLSFLQNLLCRHFPVPVKKAEFHSRVLSVLPFQQILSARADRIKRNFLFRCLLNGKRNIVHLLQSIQTGKRHAALFPDP